MGSAENGRDFLASESPAVPSCLIRIRSSEEAIRLGLRSMIERAFGARATRAHLLVFGGLRVTHVPRDSLAPVTAAETCYLLGKHMDQ